MPVTIFQPMKYKKGFAKDENGIPINGEVAAAPNDRDIKICEIARFEGWTTECFCDVGEFEITTRDVDPAHVKTDYIVYFDDRLFVIETIKWERDAEGYVCTFGGRDMWKYLESHYLKFQDGEYWKDFTTGSLVSFVNAFLSDESGGHGHGETISHFVDEFAGWFRDSDRGNRTRYRIPDGTSWDDYINKSLGLVEMTDPITCAAQVREWANALNVGLTFGTEYVRTDDGKTLFRVVSTYIVERDNGVTIDASDRGVSGFSYEYDERKMVNATTLSFDIGPYGLASDFANKPKYVNHAGIVNADIKEETGDRKEVLFHSRKDTAKNYAERAHKHCERMINLSSIPSDVNTRTKFRKWINNELTKGYTDADRIVSFAYDNHGRYRYHRDFELGDIITIKDGYIGVNSKQQLRKVKANYKAGEPVSYEFEFGKQRVTQADKLRTKFREIDRRTFGITGLTDY